MKTPRDNTKQNLLLKVAELESKLLEATEALYAIRNGEVDAIVVSGAGGEKVFSLTSSETPYRTIIEDMSEGAVCISAEGRILYSNEMFPTLLGKKTNQLVGQNFFELFPPETKSDLEILIMQAIEGKATGEVIYEKTVKGKPYLSYFRLSCRKLPLENPGDLFILVTDITQRVEDEKKLKDYQLQLEQTVQQRTQKLRKSVRQLSEYSLEMERLNKTKDKFFSIIAHDLKNPFEAILYLCNSFYDDAPDLSSDQILDNINKIRLSTELGRQLLNNLLLWSRSQTNKVSCFPLKFLFQDLVQKNIALLSPMAEAKNINIKITVTKNAFFTTDEDMFNHIFRNLLTNAIKFTPRNGEIKISAVIKAGQLKMSIADNGIGISGSDQNKLFRIDGDITSRPGTEDEKGSGLGLILVKEFIDKLGGSIHVESEPGKGSRFVFRLHDLDLYHSGGNFNNDQGIMRNFA